MVKAPIVMIIGGLVVAVVVLSLLPTMFTDMNVAFLFAGDENRNPVFGTGLGGLVPLVMGFFPVLVILGLLGVGYILHRRGRGM